MLEVRNLHVRIEDREILKGVNLAVKAGEVHSIMGPNGSGKSTLALVLAGRDSYEVTEGEVIYNGKNLLELSPEERAWEGIFLAFQYPVEIPGVTTSYFLKSALNSLRKARGPQELAAGEFRERGKEKVKLVELEDRLLNREINEGVSGGGKKRKPLAIGIASNPRATTMNTGPLTTKRMSATASWMLTLPSRKPGTSRIPNPMSMVVAKMSSTFPATSVASAVGNGT